MSLSKIPLTGPWTLDRVSSSAPAPEAVTSALPIPATVPGSVHTDLLAAGLIDDPYLDRNELDVEWIGHNDWAYSTRLTIPADGHSRHDLAFDGLDTLAHICVDGAEVATTANMHRRYRVPLDGAAGEERDLRITFDTPWGPFENADPAELVPFDGARSHIRKMASNFGWDWGPSLVTSGIWREVRIEGWSVARFASVRPDVTLGRSEAGAPLGHVQAAIRVERDLGSALEVRVAVAGAETIAHIAPGDDSVVVELDVPIAEDAIWWPRGYGEQPLHELTIELLSEGVDLDRFERRIGFRSAELDTSDDEAGSAFLFRINGVEVPIRGFNWIPDDCFPHRVTPAEIADRLDAAVEANANLIRVWGGGLFESDEFYDACDERGLLTWQDFGFACAPYPETADLAAEVEAEAIDNVERLMSHPSLVLWNGNNENWLGHDDWGWDERLAGRAWGAGYYLEVLPRVVAEVAPSANYWPGSPYSGSPDLHSNLVEHGTVHLWEPWLVDGYDSFLTYRPRFVAEFGWQGPPAWRTMTDSIHDDPLTPTSPGMLHHQKAEDGYGKLVRGLGPYFDEPVGIVDWHWAMQLNQARAIAFAVEHFRSLRPLNMGVVLWQLNDCWPVASWSVIDSENRRRPAWFATRSAFDTHLATVQPSGDGLSLMLVNDDAEAWSGTALVRRVGFDGAELAAWETEFSVPAGGGAHLPLPSDVATPGSAAAELLVIEATGASRRTRFFAPDKQLAYPDPELRISATAEGDVTEVTVTATALARDVTVHADRLGAGVVVDQALVTLLPGESTVFRLTGQIEGDLDELLTGPVVRHAADLV